ncbi:MAG: hypothetical protein E7363_03560 [Clostridiales bacterium]|nr:hypothetical protein [Clostridiales bacterium]
MNKLILKTAIITLVSAISVSVIAICAITLFFPEKTASATAKMGMYGVSANFQEIAYNRAPSISRLGTLVDYAAASENYSLLRKHCPTLLSAKNFNKYATQRDALAGEHVTGGYEQFVSGSYAVALYRNGEDGKAVEVATQAVGNGYPANNAVQYLLYDSADREDEEFLLSLTAYFTAKYTEVLAEESTVGLAPTVAMDAAFAYYVLGEDYQTEYTLWLSRV